MSRRQTSEKLKGRKKPGGSRRGSTTSITLESPEEQQASMSVRRTQALSEFRARNPQSGGVRKTGLARQIEGTRRGAERVKGKYEKAKRSEDISSYSLISKLPLPKISQEEEIRNVCPTSD